MMRSVKIAFFFVAWLTIIYSCKKTESKGEIRHSIDKIFRANFSYSATANSYQWDFGDNNFSNLAAPSHRYKYGGLYHVKLQADNQLIEKDVRILSPDSVRITSILIQDWDFDSIYADANQLYNVCWVLRYPHDSNLTIRIDTSSVIYGVNAASLPLIWNNLNIVIPVTEDYYFLHIGYYRSTDNTYYTNERGYYFPPSSIIQSQAYPDTLYIGYVDATFDRGYFECVTQWIVNP